MQTKEQLRKVFDKCLAINVERDQEWHDTFLQMPRVLYSMDPLYYASFTPERWCANMATLKLKRFYESGCKSQDSLLDAINYLGLACVSMGEPFPKEKPGKKFKLANDKLRDDISKFVDEQNEI